MSIHNTRRATVRLYPAGWEPPQTETGGTTLDPTVTLELEATHTEPKAAPKVAPKAAPKVAPNVVPKAAPKAAPNAAPHTEPKAASEEIGAVMMTAEPKTSIALRVLCMYVVVWFVVSTAIVYVFNTNTAHRQQQQQPMTPVEVATEDDKAYLLHDNTQRINNIEEMIHSIVLYMKGETQNANANDARMLTSDDGRLIVQNTITNYVPSVGNIRRAVANTVAHYVPVTHLARYVPTAISNLLALPDSD
jgi:hypothetical protein